jgi:hypothetical protein
MNINELNKRAKFFAKYIWGKDLDIDVILNDELNVNAELSLLACVSDRSYKSEESYIVINSRIMNCSYLVINDILIHELCHWSLYLDFKNNYDGDVDFEQELKRIGISSSNKCRLIYDQMYYQYNDGDIIVESLYRATEQMINYERAYLAHEKSLL